MCRVLNKFSEYIYTFTHQKTLFYTLFCLPLKSPKVFSVSLKSINSFVMRTKLLTKKKTHENSLLLKPILSVSQCLQRAPYLLKMRKSNMTQKIIVLTALRGFFKLWHICFACVLYFQFPTYGKCSIQLRCVKSVRIQRFSGPYFAYSDWIRRDTQFKCGKIRTRKTPNRDTFHVELISG